VDTSWVKIQMCVKVHSPYVTLNGANAEVHVLKVNEVSDNKNLILSLILQLTNVKKVSLNA